MKTFIRRLLIAWIVRLKVLRRPSIRYCISNGLLPSVLVRTPSSMMRELLFLPPSEYRTQLNQDIFALLMNRFRPGYFLEIGANDGFTFSNTVYLENEFGWHGILVEANQKYSTSLARRKAVIVIKALSSYIGEADFIDAGLYGGLTSCIDDIHNERRSNAKCIKVDCVSLQSILDNSEAPDIIDFVSIDVEGGEVSIVEQMVSVKRRFRCGCIEYNGRQDDFRKISSLLYYAGYRAIWKGQTGRDLFFVDERVISYDHYHLRETE